MKVFCALMALYMMALFIMPCADMHQNDSLQDVKHSTEITYQDTHNHADASDLCTPFCVCGCCGIVSGVILHWNIFDIGKVKTFDLSNSEGYYNPTFIHHYFGEIWQPPKINA